MTLQAKAEHLPADIFGLSDVTRAAIEGGPGFGPIPFVTRATDVPRPAERLGEEERRALCDHLEAGYASASIRLGDAPKVQENVRSLRREGVHCVVTGQQPGFLASPLYSLYKALQACRVAEELSAHWGESVVPVFWNHADDHDIAEVHHAWQLNRNLDLQKVVLAGLSSGRVPVGEVAITAEGQSLGALRAQLRNMVEEHPGADEALDLFMPRDGETLPRALTRAFHGLMADYGLVIAEPAWIRPLLSSEMGRIVSGAKPALTEALRAGEGELEALGLQAAIPVGRGEDGAALVYRHVTASEALPAERVALRAGGDGFREDDAPGSRTHAEVGSQVVHSPDDWSAGALVRPLVQDAVFPTCAYVGGYGELGYHAQLGPARDACGQPRTPFIPRVSMTLVDAEASYALRRVGASIEEALRAGGQYEPTEKAEEPTVIGELKSLAANMAAQLLEHKAALAEIEPALAITLKKTAQHVEASIGKVIGKADRVHQNSSGKGVRQLRRVNHTLFPREVPQERLLGPFQFVARYRGAFVPALWNEVPFASLEHIVLQLTEPAEPSGDDPQGA